MAALHPSPPGSRARAAASPVPVEAADRQATFGCEVPPHSPLATVGAVMGVLVLVMSSRRVGEGRSGATSPI